MTLAEYLTRLLREPFSWGANDCILFAAGWAKEATGVDCLADVPKWKSATGAARILKQMGGIQKVIDDRLTSIHPNLAKDGDIALVNGRIAIFSGAHLVGPGADGLIYIDRMKAERAWTFQRLRGN